MVCGNCRNQLPNGAAFCSYCGARQNTQQKSGEKINPLTLLITLAFLVIFVVYCVTGLSIPEMFQALGQRMNKERPAKPALYDFEQALANRETSFTIHRDQWDETQYSWDIAEYVIRDVLNEDPDYYYVDIRNTTIRHSNDDSQYHVSVAYFDELLEENAARQIDSAANRILEQVPAGASDWETARIIHDALIRHITYEENMYDQTIYGALVKGRAVCNGYAMAYEYLLEKAGIPCETVVGFTNEIDALTSTFSIWLGDSAAHAWNVVTLTDEKGVETNCYVDVTWDDHDTRDIYGSEYIVYDWFGVTHEAITKEGRCDLSPVFDPYDWGLSKDNMNYHTYTGAVLYAYNLDTLTDMMRTQMYRGMNVLTVRIANMDVYFDTMFSLTEGGDLSILMTNLGLEGAAYEFTYDYDGDGIICFNLYLNYQQS